MAIAKSPGGQTPEQLELARIVSLPLIGLPDSEAVEIFCFDNMLAGAYEAGERLWPTQVAAVDGYRRFGGGLLPIGVGWGKTGISLMIAEAAYQAGLKKIVLLVPPQLVPGLVKRHIPEWRRRVPMSIPFHFLAGRGASARRSIVESGAAGVYVYPYSLLSASDAVELLEAIQPELVIADEVHNLKNPKAARTKRLLHFLRELSPRPQLVGMSGTITAKTIGDYHHLASLALREHSPLPRSASMAFFWGQILNADADAPTGYAKGLLSPIIGWARAHFPTETFRQDQTESYRRAYRHRLVSAPGVTATGDEQIGVSLRLENIEFPGPGTELLELIRGVEEGLTPQGEPIDHAMHGFKWLYELSFGFYNSLLWPTEEELMKNRKISQPEAELLLVRARMHLRAVQDYHKFLREFFKNAPLGLDTPREVGRSISMHGSQYVGSAMAALWNAVKAADFEGRPERYNKPVRVDDFKIRQLVSWAKEYGRGLVWIFHQEAGKWLMESMALADFPALYAPAGADDLIENVGDPGRGGKGDAVVVASMSSHGTGRNLQAFQNQIFGQWPRPAHLAEQTIGRTHRNGQEADELVVHTLMNLTFDHINRAACLQDAIYIQQTTGARQKIVYADYDPMPVIYSPEFLREQGATPEMLNREQRDMLASLFGPEVE